MREAGYLTAMYENVFLDIGEVFPVVSRRGQEALIQQILELTPTNKIMWSSELFFIVSSQRNGNLENYVRSQVTDIGGPRHTTWAVLKHVAHWPR